MERYWHEFEDKEENKLCYMNIFKEYVRIHIFFVIKMHILWASEDGFAVGLFNPNKAKLVFRDEC
jgi:hypothetical protein